MLSSRSQKVFGLQKGARKLPTDPLSLFFTSSKFAIRNPNSRSSKISLLSSMKLFQKKQSHATAPEVEEMTEDERIRAAGERKIKGNDLFKDGKPREAMEQYEMAFAYLRDDFMGRLSGEYREKALDVKTSCHLNMAAGLLKLNRYGDAIVQCNIVLSHDENNVKALYRRGKAKAELGQAAAAQEDLLKACKLAPESNKLADELKALTADMVIEETLRKAEQKKTQGNAFYKDGKLREAVQEYDKAISYMADGFMVKLSGKYHTRAMELKIPCHLNIAACFLKLKRYEETIWQCNIVLTQDENNVKALFRRGKASVELGRTDAAREDLLKARKLAPEDETIANELRSLVKDDKAVYQKQKELYKGIFGPRMESEAFDKHDEDTLLESISFKPKVNLTRRARKGKYSTDNDYW